MNLNSAVWNPKNATARVAFQEVWFLKINDPAQNRALWLRFNLLISRNGFRRIAETWAILSSKSPQKETSSCALKQTSELTQFAVESPTHIRVQDCELRFDPSGSGFTRGAIRSKGNTIQWDLQFKSPDPANASFHPFPDFLSQCGVLGSHIQTISENLLFSGKVEFNGQPQTWLECPGMVSHAIGSRLAPSWVWSHCCSFVDEKGAPSPFLFEGYSTQPRLPGGIPTPRLSALFFLYREEPYCFNNAWANIRTRSHFSLNEWQFQADTTELSFRGNAKAELKDFAGLTFEDTSGALIYGSLSQLSDLKIHVYRRGKIESSFIANGTAAYHCLSHEKTPYVPLLL